MGRDTILKKKLYLLLTLLLAVSMLPACSKKKEEEKTAEAPKAPVPSNEEKLLMEIRDLLKNQK